MTQRTGFHKKFKFIIEEAGIAVAAFQKASELSVEAAKIEYYEGGSLTPNKSPGRLTFSDVTLDRGVTADQDLYNWFKQVADAAADTGLNEPDFKRTLDIVQQDRLGDELRRWRLVNAWPTKFTAGEWDNEADENVIEQVTLTYDYFELVVQPA